MHYLLTIGTGGNWEFRAELLIKSINHFSYGKRNFFSIVVNGNEFESFDEIKLTKWSVRNKYLNKQCDIWYSPYIWQLWVPHRWFIEPKCETCVIIDADMIACKDISNIYNLDKDKFYGVKASDKILTEEEWKSLELPEWEKYYFNFGMLIFPSKIMKSIGEELIKEIDILSNKIFNKTKKYFIEQIALALVLKRSIISVNSLDNKFNWFEFNPYREDIVFLHYLYSRCSFFNVDDILDFPNENQYKNLIKRSVKDFYFKNSFI